jgi:DNA-binding CsgD family transcriptional regulator
MAPLSPVGLDSVVNACTRGTAGELVTLRGRLESGSTGALLADAVIAHCDGDVARADRILRNAWHECDGVACRAVAEMWLPILISLQRFEEAESILADDRIDTAEARFAALRCVIAASRGDAPRSRELAADAESGLADEADPTVRARVHQRLALAAFLRTEPEVALRHAAAAVALARSNRAHRTAATAHSVAYATHSSITGDVLAALRSARDMAADATLAGDRSYRALGLVAAYEVLVELADDDGVAATLELLRATPLPEQYAERFSCRVADAMTQATHGDFAAARNVFVVLADEDGRSPGERALSRSLAALCNLAVGDEDAARKLSRRAIGGSARPPAGLPAYELRHRRLARAIGCATCLLLGDAVRADRRADAMLVRADANIAGLVGAGRGVKAAVLSPNVRGYARLIEAVFARRSALAGAGPLTATEIEIFRQLDAGFNAPQIASAQGRSPYTIRTHVRNAIEKLHARGRLDALARARRLGLLQER